MVLLDNHLHAILTLPEGDTRYSARWGWIKKEFTKAYLAAGGIEQALSGSRILAKATRGFTTPFLGTYSAGRGRLCPAFRLYPL